MAFKLNIKEGVDYLTLDYEGFRQMMINRLKEKLPEYTDYSETDMGVILIELLAHGLDIVAYYKDRQALECFLPTARERKNVIALCKTYFGYTLTGATPAIFVQVFETTGETTFSKSAGDHFRVKTKEEQGESSIYYELIGSLDVNDKFSTKFEIGDNHNGLERDESTGKYLYRALVCQGVTVDKEFMGFSDGSAYQKYSTSQSPALDYDSTDRYNESVVDVFVGEDEEPWERVDNFLLSKPDSKQYVFSVDEWGNGVLEFGNDISGKIPPENSKIQITYRVGGGTDTNVGANTITELDTAEAGVIKTFNPETALILGTDAESIEEAKTKAPASLRALDRAVTIRDYADIGLQIDSVSSAQSVLCTVEDNKRGFKDRNDSFIAGDPYSDIINGKAPYNHSTEDGSSASNDGYVLTWLMLKDPDVDSTYKYTDSLSHIHMSDDMLSYLRTDYYLNRKMIGQRFNVFPADIEWVVPHLRITVDSNYTKSSVTKAVENKLIELMALGKYQLEQSVIWSEIVKELLDGSTGVTGLRSAIFVDVDSTHTTAKTSRIIADDKPSRIGRVYALKRGEDYTKESPVYEVDIYAEGGLNNE